MAKFTLLELHLDGSEFTANAPFSSTADEGSEPADAGDTEADESAGGGHRTGRLAFLAFVFIALAAVAVRRLRKGQSEDSE